MEAVSIISKSTDQIPKSVALPIQESSLEKLPKNNTVDAVNVLLSKVNTSIEEAEKKSQEDPQQQVKQNIDNLKAAIPNFSVKFEVAVQEGKSGEIHFQIVDKESGEVIREYPSDKFQTLVTNLKSGGNDSLALINQAA